MRELGGQNPGHELTGHRGHRRDRGDRRMVSLDGGFIIIIIAVRVRSPGGDPSRLQELRPGKARVGLGGAGRLQAGHASPGAPGGSRGSAGSTAAALRDASKAKSQKAGLRESCCAEGPRCCWGWVGSFRGGRCGTARGGAVGRGSLARGFGSFLLLRVFPTALVGGKAPAQLWLEFPALETAAP